uniref:Uncharacterized protein n=1 Tax=Arundo donax TaxID=35708 RepID=A0A0A9EFG5_ARUDO
MFMIFLNIDHGHSLLSRGLIIVGDHLILHSSVPYIHINCPIFHHLCDSDSIFQILEDKIFYNVEFFWWCYILIQMYSRVNNVSRLRK